MGNTRDADLSLPLSFSRGEKGRDGAMEAGQGRRDRSPGSYAMDCDSANPLAVRSQGWRARAEVRSSALTEAWPMRGSGEPSRRIFCHARKNFSLPETVYLAPARMLYNSESLNAGVDGDGGVYCRRKQRYRDRVDNAHCYFPVTSLGRHRNR